MASITLLGVSSVLDRILFTKRAPIVKQPLAILTGLDLVIVSPIRVQVASANFTSDDVGKSISISGSAGSRNDGTFEISNVLNSITVELAGVNFDIVDASETTGEIAALANALKAAVNSHFIHVDSRVEYPSLTHVSNDTINTITAPTAFDLATSIALLNQIRSSLIAHFSNTGGDFHTHEDTWNEIVAGAADSIADAIALANDLLTRYERHRIERRSHYLGDSDSRVGATAVGAIRQLPPGSLVGPFSWTLFDLRRGMIADSSDDVSVNINGFAVVADAVFGMIGAVVLPSKPDPADTVTIDYDHINNPPSRFLRLNSPEFVLNQDKNNGIMGLPFHKYRARSYMIDPGHTPDLISSTSPLTVGWKYKAFEREYSATTNDPNKLLLNSPINKIKYPVLNTTVKEITLSYDPIVVPQSSVDPWKLEGEGTTQIVNNLLSIVDDNQQSPVTSKPPFYTHASDIISSSLVSAAFRVVINDFTSDGVFTGVGFGISDGYNVALAGLILTDATNLTSAITMANSIKANLNLHVVQPTVHNPNDPTDAVEIVDAKDLDSLVILVNAIKLRFNLHLEKADPTHVTAGIHQLVDTANQIFDADAVDLGTAISLVNSIRDKFNSHRSSVGVHFANDIYNEVPQVKQIGILTNAGASEFQESWEASSVDWSILKTYRMYRDTTGGISIYTSGDVLPLITIDKSRLPSISDFGGKFDPIQQVFFGSISREATSDSSWGLIRANVSPINTNLLEDNKSVILDGTAIPEDDTINPWITLGHGGTERVLTGGGIQTESTCSAGAAELTAMGASSGAFRGYMRFEPMLSPSTSSTVEFSASVDYYTFSVGNQSHGLFIDDGQQSVHFAFLHYAPMPARVVGSRSVFSIAPLDKMIISLDGGSEVLIVFSSVIITAAAAAAVINTAMGMAIASDDGLGHVQLVYGSGSSSYISISGGSSSGNAATKLGIAAGKYFGSDSNPEPRISWFGENPPDAEAVPWVKSGGQSIYMLGTAYAPTMRIDDSAIGDYAAFTMSNKAAITGSVDPSTDWKLDARFAVISFAAGEAVPGTIPLVDLYFCGALVNVDEGYGGKNIELHCSADASGQPFLNLVSYFPGTDEILPIAQYAFAWNDGQPHSFNIFTNKTADQVFVFADGVMLVPVAGIASYSLFGPATGGTPSVTFGSGSGPVTNVDLSTSLSIVDWSSVAAFRDSKLSDPSAHLHRYIGIYKGGNPSLMGSWYVASLDWSLPHVYRLVRDPIGIVAVYVDGSDTPSLSVSYNPITLPPSSSSFLKLVSNDRSVIAWGALNPVEMSRGTWNYLRYSMGKLSLTDRIVPPHHVLNQANVMVSSDHLKTAEPHAHWGFSAYSGGTPDDEFMANPLVAAATILGEGTPPVPMTQDLESRGGLIKQVTPAASVSAVDFMDYRGFLGNFEDDDVNIISVGPAQDDAAILSITSDIANGVSAVYETHRVRHNPAANAHVADDILNVITTLPATDLPTLIVRLTEFKAVFNNHLINAGAHDPIDPLSTIGIADPIDLNSCIDVANLAIVKYGEHLDKGCFHHIPAVAPFFDTSTITLPDATDAASCFSLLNEIVAMAGSKYKFSGHAAESLWHGKIAKFSASLSYSSMIPLANLLRSLFDQHRIAPEVHQFDDSINAVLAGTAYDVPSCILLTNAIKASFNRHIAGHHVHLVVARDVSGALQDRYAAAPVVYQLQQTMELANDIREKLNGHVARILSHVESDEQNLVSEPEAIDLTTLIALVNAEKAAYNAHRIAEVRTCKVHVRDDTINVVVSADATDLASATVLANDIRSVYESHRVQPGIHGSLVFIRLEAPSGVLYEGMKFWTTESGTAGLVHPISDDDSWKVSVVSTGTNPATIVGGDDLMLDIDHTPTMTVVFAPTDTTLSAVISKINITVGFILASEVSSELKLTSPTPGPGSSLDIVGGTAVAKLFPVYGIVVEPQ